MTKCCCLYIPYLFSDNVVAFEPYHGGGASFFFEVSSGFVVDILQEEIITNKYNENILFRKCQTAIRATKESSFRHTVKKAEITSVIQHQFLKRIC